VYNSAVLTSIYKKLFSRRRISSASIDPDEIFLDSSNLPQFDTDQFEGRIEKPITRSTFVWLGIFFLLVGIVYSGRVWVLQVKNGEAFEIRSENNHLRHATVFAPRGVIYDRNRVALAWNDLNPDSQFSLRKYLPIEGFAHLVGYLRYPAKDSAGNFYNDEFIGKDGVEEYFNQELTGTNGLKITETNALEEVQSESTLIAPKPGNNLTLAVDSRVQKIIHEVIKNTAQERDFSGGAGVIMDVHTGEIIALTSYPQYDQNIMTQATDRAAITAFLTNEDTPFIDRAVSGLYVPGSIMKPFIAIGVLEEKIISPEKKIQSVGAITIPNRFNPSQPTIFRDWKVHGWVDMREAIAVSSDEYFYTVGGGYGDQKGIGILNIEKYVRMFGFGSMTGINIVGEKKGTIPSPQWKAEMFDGEVWKLGNTYHSSIGQYGFQTTVIQVTRAVAAIANGGKLVTPTVLIDSSANNKEVATLPFSKEYFNIIEEGMRLGVTAGTAKALNFSYLDVAAKTGTAELGITKNFVNSWVTGYFPYENPRYAFAILMEKGHRDNLVGASSVMRKIFDQMKVETPEYVQQ
jgi:penicillin-binding protein 2